MNSKEKNISNSNLEVIPQYESFYYFHHMKALRYIILVGTLLIYFGCDRPDLEIEFHKQTDLVIPAEGGSYYFEVEAIEAIETKTSFGNFLRAFEYRVMVDENIIEQELLQISAVNDYIEPGDKYKVEFEVPENAEQQERNIRVDILLAKDNKVYDSFYGNDDHVDPGDNTWETIWEAVQLAY